MTSYRYDATNRAAKAAHEFAENIRESLGQSPSELIGQVVAETAQIAKELSELKDDCYFGAPYDGNLQLYFVEMAAKEALRGENLNEEERQSLLHDLIGFRNDFAALGQGESKYEKETVLRLIERALFIGYSVGFPSDRLHEIRLMAVNERQARAGKASGSKRRLDRKWVPHATELIIAVCNENPNQSRDKIATEVSCRWKSLEVPVIGFETLKKHIADLEREGRITRKLE